MDISGSAGRTALDVAASNVATVAGVGASFAAFALSFTLDIDVVFVDGVGSILVRRASGEYVCNDVTRAMDGSTAPSSSSFGDGRGRLGVDSP